MSHELFISYASEDKETANAVCTALEEAGISCWIAPRNVPPGFLYGEAIIEAIANSKVLVLVFSSHSNKSSIVIRELERAVIRNMIILTFSIEHVEPSNKIKLLLSNHQCFDASRAPLKERLSEFFKVIRSILPKETKEELSKVGPNVPQRESKGYVFISYLREDRDFVRELITLLDKWEYAYWEYFESLRNYHGILYRELEDRIANAAAFVSIVSDNWRDSDWLASEFIYARESRIPIFIIQAKPLQKPLPILLNLQTRIDMSNDFDRHSNILEMELKKKGL